MSAMTFQQTSARSVARPAAPVRLTRRGRLVLLFVLMLVALAAFSLGRVSTEASSAPPSAARTVVVQPGDTLWSIARRVAPDADPRVTVERLRSANDLDGALQAGQRLTLVG